MLKNVALAFSPYVVVNECLFVYFPNFFFAAFAGYPNLFNDFCASPELTAVGLGVLNYEAGFVASFANVHGA